MGRQEKVLFYIEGPAEEKMRERSRCYCLRGPFTLVLARFGGLILFTVEASQLLMGQQEPGFSQTLKLPVKIRTGTNASWELFP
jgi:hypothetical protein